MACFFKICLAVFCLCEMTYCIMVSWIGSDCVFITVSSRPWNCLFFCCHFCVKQKGDHFRHCTAIAVRLPLVSAKTLTPHWFPEIPNQRASVFVLLVIWISHSSHHNSLGMLLDKKTFFAPLPHSNLCVFPNTCFMVKCRKPDMYVSSISSNLSLLLGGPFFKMEYIAVYVCKWFLGFNRLSLSGNMTHTSVNIGQLAVMFFFVTTYEKGLHWVLSKKEHAFPNSQLLKTPPHKNLCLCHPPSMSAPQWGNHARTFWSGLKRTAWSWHTFR